MIIFINSLKIEAQSSRVSIFFMISVSKKVIDEKLSFSYFRTHVLITLYNIYFIIIIVYNKLTQTFLFVYSMSHRLCDSRIS